MKETLKSKQKDYPESLTSVLDSDLTPSDASVLPQTVVSFSARSDRMRRQNNLKMDHKHIFGNTSFSQRCKSWSSNPPVLSRALPLLNAQPLSRRSPKLKRQPWCLPLDHQRETCQTPYRQTSRRQTLRGTANYQRTMQILVERLARPGAG